MVKKVLSGDGSPPPMRGKACFFQLGDVPAGITPAYAGKRKSENSKYSSSKDHPRLCGEKFRTAWEKIVQSGITPAYAGKSFSRAATST